MHLKTKIAEYGIILNEKNEFLMLRFAKDEVPSQKWIFPGGRLDDGEEPKLGLLREITEETNLDIELLNPIDVSMWGIDHDHRYAIFFLCKLVSNPENIKLSHEHQDYKWYSFDELDNIDYHRKHFKEVLIKVKDQFRS
ncbi:NUDIX domain-containing protein [Nanoarchaeota archaeon]